MSNRAAAQASSNRPVLLVEGNEEARERLYDLLTRRGLRVLTVHSADHAIKAMQHDRPCLVLANAILSDMSGTELASRLRSLDAQLPIILLGDPPAHAAPLTASDGQQAMLPADATQETLLQTVDRFLTAPAQSALRTRWPGTILVVDDDPRCCFLLQEFLEVQGLAVSTVGSGEEALQHIERSSPTVILLDINMRGMDGLLTLKKIKALRPKTTVIMITGLEEEETLNKAMALGADDYITKPFDRAYLETTLLSKILLGRVS